MSESQVSGTKTFVASFRAMGSPCRIVVNEGAREAALEARHLIEDLELRWSRFLPQSEISQLNRCAGQLMIVSKETYTLIDHACVARAATHGVFNPLMLSQLEDLGYRQPWIDGPPETRTGRADQSRAGQANKSSGEQSVACLEEIQLLPELSAVCLPKRTQFDPGGIGKGLAADLATELLLASGATTISVELGGDVRVTGKPWYGPSWRIGVSHPFDDGAEVAAFTPDSGAVATSSRLGRRWTVGAEARHHLLDPGTGRSAETDLVASTACAATAWWAEVVAKVVLIGGSEAAHGCWQDLAASGIAVTEEGDVLQSTLAPATQLGETAQLGELVQPRQETVRQETVRQETVRQETEEVLV